MSEPNEQELLPCPFCGEDPVCEGKTYRYSLGSVVNPLTCAVTCTGCKTRFGTHYTRKQAKEIWNRYASAAPQWTTEPPPKEEGLYICTNNGINRFLIRTYFSKNKLMVQDSEESRFVPLTRFCKENGKDDHWIKIELPPLPEGKENPMSSIQVFNSPEFGKVRTIQKDGEPWFVAKDVAQILGYVDTVNAIKQHCKGIAIYHPLQTAGGVQEIRIIGESDVMRMIFGSRLPEAEKFERWVFDEVLPSIRKHGAYMTDDALEKALTSPDFLIRLATELKTEKERRITAEQTIVEQQDKIESDKPKVLFCDAVAASQTDILVGELAKILNQNGVNIGQNRLFECLRNEGYLCSVGSSRNMPTQRSMAAGLFRIKETTITHSDGHISVNKTTKVTGKGQVYFVNHYVKNRFHEIR